MKRIVLLSSVFLCSLTAFADEQVRQAQTELKAQGFYYGEITGQASTETSAAVRRYQIRHGLEVTGTLTKETLNSLGGSPSGASTQATRPAPVQPRPKSISPPPATQQQDKEFLRREETAGTGTARTLPPQQRAPAQAPAGTSKAPPVAMDLPSPDFAVLFDETPYATAPRVVQESTVRRAQTILAARGFYRDPIDGSAGAATEEALLSFQRKNDLPLSGRLDLETLSLLRLLPGRPATRSSLPPSRLYRGTIVR
ncbi:MAG TPA: peptidoglycan-binding domain-containing protein [Chthoniobacteraceae bacterium]|jgi:peptidoglycan hydrolase-like protein with peptidoglycan-binding domain